MKQNFKKSLRENLKELWNNYYKLKAPDDKADPLVKKNK